MFAPRIVSLSKDLTILESISSDNLPALSFLEDFGLMTMVRNVLGLVFKRLSWYYRMIFSVFFLKGLGHAIVGIIFF